MAYIRGAKLPLHVPNFYLMAASENSALPVGNPSPASDSGIHGSDAESITSTSFDSISRPSTSASSIVPFVFPTTAPAYVPALRELQNLLRTFEPSSEQVQTALHQLTFAVPFHPRPQIIAGPPLNWHPKVRVDAHLNSTFEEALNNIGTPLCDREKMYLEYIIQCFWGWSATPKQHRNASGFRYLQVLYAQLHGLRPILDDGIWPEEAQYFPQGLLPGPPFHIILASDSGYYFHRMDEAVLYQAGNTLEEVFEGLKNCKYTGPAGPNNDEWEGVDPCTDFFEPSQYFPNYRFNREEGHWVLGWEIPEPPESMDKYHEIPGIPISRFY